MAQRKLLLDTNAYLRLARSIHPLLFTEFGADRTCLYLVEAFEREFSRSRRLQGKFGWVDDDQFRDNRQAPLQIGRKERRMAETAAEFMSDAASSARLGLSPVDVAVLAHGYALEHAIVTDDQAMRELASEFGVRTLGTLELLREMLDRHHITMEKVRQIGAYWRFDRDLPAAFETDFLTLFDERPP